MQKKKIQKRVGGIRKTAVVEDKSSKLLGIVFAVVAVLTLAAIGLPVVFWSQSGNAAMSVREDYKNEVRQQLGAEVSRGCAQSDTHSFPNGQINEAQAVCLNQCQAMMSSCLEGNYDNDDVNQSCTAQAEKCIGECEAPKVALTCQDRCAVLLGGCLRGVIDPKKIVVEDEAGALTSCFTQNLSCLINECNLQNQNVLPIDYCADQCDRVLGICSAGEGAYNLDARQNCERGHAVCMRVLCGMAKASSGF